MRITLLSLFIVPLWLMAGSAAAASPTGGDSTSAAAWIAGCRDNPELCVPRCQRDPLFCGRQINAYLLEPVGGTHRFAGFPLYPGSLRAHVNTGTPMHGAHLTITVNEVAQAYIAQLQGDPGAVDRVDFPNGALIVKQNAVGPDMDPSDPPWLTVMFKLDGYCTADFGGTGPCTGGEWFYYLYRFGEFHYFDGVPALGKAEAFCIDCHAPVMKGDFLYSAFFDLKAHQPATLTVPAETAATGNVALFCEGLPISPDLPGDVARDPSKLSPEQAQLMFDCLSWRSFLALNWPNLPEPDGPVSPWRGLPDTGKPLTAPGPRVWETYRTVFETFQPDDPDWSLKDRDWDDPVHFDPVCRQDSIDDKVLRMTAKQRNSTVLDETHQAFGNAFNILVDQNGRQALFEVRLNRDEFEYLKANGFATTGAYDVGGPLDQLSWQAEPLQLPDNVRGATKIGTIEIKASWRVLCTDPGTCSKVDDPGRYYTRDAVFYVRDPRGGEGSCTQVTVGLVGMHIAHKTFWTPQWVWSTFEHVENVPPAGSYPISHSATTDYGFYSPRARTHQPSITDCRTQRPGVFPPGPHQPKGGHAAACPNLQSIANSHPGSIPAGDGSPTRMADGGLTPNQVTRIDPMSTSSLNQDYPAKLATLDGQGSVFQHYRLVNTQWPLNGRGQPIETTINMVQCPGSEMRSDCYTLVPLGLALRNTTMETFQVSYDLPKKDANGQASSAGCMQCHGGPGLDFSFVWTDAVEEPVPLRRDDLSVPPRGSYRQSCVDLEMVGIDLTARCRTHAGDLLPAKLRGAHSCSGDIANINGKLLCNPPLGSFVLTCDTIDVQQSQQGTTLTAQCLRANGTTRVPASLDITGYHGVIENCDGALTRGRCG